jgi:hypothetical protein
MPKCLDCNNTREFITAVVEFEVAIYEGEDLIDNYAGDRERIDETYPPECKECGGTKIEGSV